MVILLVYDRSVNLCHDIFLDCAPKLCTVFVSFTFIGRSLSPGISPVHFAGVLSLLCFILFLVRPVKHQPGIVSGLCLLALFPFTPGFHIRTDGQHFIYQHLLTGRAYPSHIGIHPVYGPGASQLLRDQRSQLLCKSKSPNRLNQPIPGLLPDSLIIRQLSFPFPLHPCTSLYLIIRCGRDFIKPKIALHSPVPAL